MSIILVTYDLITPGQKYKAVHDYINANFTWCKGLESAYLLDTTRSTTQIRDELRKIVDGNDKVFVVKITSDWASLNYYCADWLNKPERNW